MNEVIQKYLNTKGPFEQISNSLELKNGDSLGHGCQCPGKLFKHGVAKDGPIPDGVDILNSGVEFYWSKTPVAPEVTEIKQIQTRFLYRTIVSAREHTECVQIGDQYLVLKFVRRDQNEIV